MFTNLNKDIMNYENGTKKFDENMRKKLNKKFCEKIRDPFFFINMFMFDHLHTNRNYSDWYYKPWMWNDTSTVIELPMFMTRKDLGK